MASCSCISDLLLSRTAWPRTIELREGITSRNRTQRSSSIIAARMIELSEGITSRSRTQRSSSIIAAMQLRLQQLDHAKTSCSRSRSRSIGVAAKEKRFGAQLDDWKTSGTSSDTLNAQLVRDDLLGLIAGEERGLRTQRDALKRDQIIKAIDALAILGAETVTTDESLSAAWRVLWTTEKEQLFIVEKAHLFGTEAGDILQVIDVAGRTLNNVITFPPTGIFLVNSTIEIESAQRVNFKFTKASLRIGGWKFPFPPLGQGWFESMYLDDKIRVGKDIRGDYLVADRASSVPDLL